jgi:phosphoribosyl-ATP pyrophosphohydrolase/phosphoribosyl-AMP cyclohydrolase/histidinol dehydrogenase
MTAVTARAAGVPKVIIASPKPTQHTLAAAAIAGCDVFLALGGAQAIGVLTFGAPEVNIPPCGLIAGPGNKWVTAAKYLATRYTCIDMLAGPSEVLIIADATADAGVVAADMLAQAEHDTDASAVLVTTSPALADAVEAQLDLQLADLPTHATARAALECNSYIVVVNSVDEAITISDSIAPEHLEVLTAHPRSIAERLRHYGAVFIGTASGEVLGDYGAGPNHVLPTGGLGRSIGGLSVLNFLKVQTFLECNNNSAHTELVGDAAAMGRIEGLEAHARAAERRRVARSS